MDPVNCKLLINGEVEERCSDFRCDTSRNTVQGGYPSNIWQDTIELTLYLLPKNSSYPLPGDSIDVLLSQWYANVQQLESIEFNGVVETACSHWGPGEARTVDISAIGAAQYKTGTGPGDGPTYPRIDSELHFHLSVTAEDKPAIVVTYGDFQLPVTAEDKSRRESFVAFVPETVYGVRVSNPVWVPLEPYLAEPRHYRCRCEVLIGADWPVRGRKSWLTWEPFGSDFVLNWGTYNDRR